MTRHLRDRSPSAQLREATFGKVKYRKNFPGNHGLGTEGEILDEKGCFQKNAFFPGWIKGRRNVKPFKSSPPATPFRDPVDFVRKRRNLYL